MESRAQRTVALVTALLCLLTGCASTGPSVEEAAEEEHAKRCGHERPPLTVHPFVTADVDALPERAAPDCAEGRHVLMLTTPELKVMSKLELLERVIARGKCVVGTATLDADAEPGWTYASWNPDVVSGEKLRTDAVSYAQAVRHEPGSKKWRPAAHAALQQACVAGREALVVLPPGLPERQRQTVLASLRGAAGKCELRTAVFDRPAISKATMILSYRLPWSGKPAHYFDHELPGAPEEPVPEPPPPPPPPPAYDVTSPPIPLGEVQSRRIDGPGANASRAEPLLSHIPEEGPAIVGLWASWCKPCLEPEELDLVRDLARRARSSGVPFLDVADASGDLSGEVQRARGISSSRPLVFPIHVAESRLSLVPGHEDDFSSLPLFLVIRDRQVVAARTGKLDERAVTRLARAALAPLPELPAIAGPDPDELRPRRPAPPPPSRLERTVDRATAAYAARDYSTAARLLEQALSLSGSDDPRLLWNLARSRALAGQCDASEAAFERFRAARPDGLGRSLPGYE